MHTDYTPEFVEHLWANIVKGDGCWTWKLTHFPSGYAQIGHYGITKGVHRILMELEHGDLAKEIHICHTCDNKWCVNPSHLFPGTCADNMADKVAKGRQARGEMVASSKLSAEEVVLIRRIHAESGKTYKEVGEMFGIKLQTVFGIVKRISWKHIP